MFVSQVVPCHCAVNKVCFSCQFSFNFREIRRVLGQSADSAAKAAMQEEAARIEEIRESSPNNKRTKNRNGVTDVGDRRDSVQTN